MKVIESLTKKGSVYLPENISENLNQFDILFYVIFWLFNTALLLVGLILFGLVL